MTSAEPAGPEAVHTTALVDGRQVEGEAWFRAHTEDRRLEWGSEGPNDYRGELTVTGDDTAAEVTITLHTTRVDSAGIDAGLQETVTTIKRLVEAS